MPSCRASVGPPVVRRRKKDEGDTGPKGDTVWVHRLFRSSHRRDIDYQICTSSRCTNQFYRPCDCLGVRASESTPSRGSNLSRTRQRSLKLEAREELDFHTAWRTMEFFGDSGRPRLSYCAWKGKVCNDYCISVITEDCADKELAPRRSSSN